MTGLEDEMQGTDGDIRSFMGFCMIRLGGSAHYDYDTGHNSFAPP